MLHHYEHGHWNDWLMTHMNQKDFEKVSKNISMCKNSVHKEMQTQTLVVDAKLSNQIMY